MLFPQRFWAGLADGSVTVAFRRWRRPQVVAGRRYQSPGGVLEVERVDVVAAGEVSDADAARAGYPDAAALLAELERYGGPDAAIHRVEFHRAGADPRLELRTRVATGEELADLRRRLDRLDRAATAGPWTRATLRLIAARPGLRAADLAASVGRQRLAFKTDVRKLKALGLTESLPVGYRIARRGEALLAAEVGAGDAGAPDGKEPVQPSVDDHLG